MRGGPPFPSFLEPGASLPFAAMRILHVGKYYAPHKGGMETALRLMARGCSRRGMR